MVWDKKKWMKEYKQKHRDEINKYARRYYKNNKAKHVVLVQRWKRENPEKVAAYNEKMMEPEFRERRRLYLQKWREKNKKHLKTYHKKWKEKKDEALGVGAMMVPLKSLEQL